MVDDEATRQAALAIIDEARSVPMEWGQKSLAEIGDEVRAVMRQRHPQLSDPAVRKLGSYFTYLVR